MSLAFAFCSLYSVLIPGWRSLVALGFVFPFIFPNPVLKWSQHGGVSTPCSISLQLEALRGCVPRGISHWVHWWWWAHGQQCFWGQADVLARIHEGWFVCVHGSRAAGVGSALLPLGKCLWLWAEQERLRHLCQMLWVGSSAHSLAANSGKGNQSWWGALTLLRSFC